MEEYNMDRMTVMETYVAVFETGSFSGGARRMNVGQPAVSKTIAQLETKLGVRLLSRSTRGLTPTEAGQQFYERAKRSIDEADEAELAARGAGTSLSGKLRICAAVSFARLHIVPAMKSFLAEHPDLIVEIVLDDRNIDLLEAGIDVALRMGNLEDSNMTARKISESRRVVVGTPSYFSQTGIPAQPADLINHQAVIYDQRGGGSAWTFKHGSTEVAVAVSGRMVVSAAEGVRAAVLADMGVAIASEWMFAPELQSGAVQSVLNDWSLPPVGLWAVYPTGRMASVKARAFVAFVEDILDSPKSQS
jgi:DNA-binding transcriptional LysR family regulator